MCTAILLPGEGALFGRTLDLEYSLDEKIILVPRGARVRSHIGRLAYMGVGIIREGLPLIYDGVNECGIAAAALNFPRFAQYPAGCEGGEAIASFELLPRILSSCATLDEAKALLESCFITAEAASPELPPTPLHFILADSGRAIVAEPTPNGLKIYENEVGVLTNSPTFDYHVTHLEDYRHLSPSPKERGLYSRGICAYGLPGDFSSASRFVRADFLKAYVAEAPEAASRLSRYFHIMDSLSVPCGAVLTDEGKEVRTVYTSCYSLSEPALYLTTYSRRSLISVHLNPEELISDETVSLEIPKDELICELYRDAKPPYPIQPA